VNFAVDTVNTTLR